MSKPDVPLRFEFSIEVPGTPEEVWRAIATGEGISSWFLPTDLEEREGGRIVTYMGEDSSPGTVTGWEPPERLVYEEPGWAELTGNKGADVTPLVTEFLVEAKSGGTCVVRVVSSAFGTGAEWEREFFDGMAKGWVPFFGRLRLYLEHFSGQTAVTLHLEARVAGTGASVHEVICEQLGVLEVGQELSAFGVEGTVERIGENDVLLRLSAPVPGFLGFASFDAEEGETVTFVQGQVFGDGAQAFVERERPKWQEWLEGLETRAARR